MDDRNSKLSLIFVCHYFPPDRSVGIRRVLFWVNYFSSKGVDVTVLTTPKKDAHRAYSEVHRNVSIYEFGYFGARMLSRDYPVQEQKQSSDSGESTWIKLARSFKQRIVNNSIGQLIDNRLVYAIPFILNLLFFSKSRRYRSIFNVQNNMETKVLVSTAPPWPIHLVASSISRAFGLPFIMDYRDPFYGNHVFSSKLSGLEKVIDRYLCRSSDAVTTVSPSWVEHYKQLSDNVRLIRNGYDESKMVGIEHNSVVSINSSGRSITLGYFGSIEIESRIPKNLLRQVVEPGSNLEIHFFGRCDLAQEFVRSLPGVLENCKFHGLIDYTSALEYMRNMDINIVCESDNIGVSERGLIPTKVYEYVRSYRPIIAIMNEEHDSVEILRRSGLLIRCVASTFKDFSFIGDLSSINLYPDQEYITTLSRENGAVELQELISELGGAND